MRKKKGRREREKEREREECEGSGGKKTDISRHNVHSAHAIDVLQVVIWDIRGTVEARWTAAQQVKRSILHQGHDSLQNSSH